MKPQTFEEWFARFDAIADMIPKETKDLIHCAFQAGHENAALVADYHGAIWVGGAIREQGRK